jgi:outer membrane biosynthesis protein TonB
MSRFLLAIPLLVLALGLEGCAALSAKNKAADLPALNVPPPPPRVIEPAPEPRPEPVNELPAAPLSPGLTRGTRPPAPRPAPPPDTKPVPDPKPVEPPPSTDPAPVPQPPAAPAAQLRTPQTADAGNAEKTVRSTLDRARGLLSNVDYRLLNSERKKAYNDAQGFIKQSEDALKEANFVFAAPLAVKAETLAKELAGK